MRRVLVALLPLSVLVSVSFNATAQSPEANYDEAKVPKYTLPDPLVMENGERVTDAETWRTKRRPEILRLFEEHMFGKSPGRPPAMSFETDSIDEKALGGKATREADHGAVHGQGGRSEDGHPDLLAQARPRSRCRCLSD